MITWKRKFVIIWTGQAISIFTSSIIHMAIIWYLTDKTKSATILSLATLAGFLPQAVLGPFIGVLIDRYDRKKIMILADLSIAFVTLLLAIVSWFATLPIWLIMMVLFLRSIGTAFHEPSLQAVTPIIVPKEYLTNCAGYTQAMESVSFLLSPAVAAILYSKLNISLILLTDIVGAAIAVLTILIIKIPQISRTDHEVAPNLLREAKEGFRALRQEKGMMSLMMIGSLYAMIYFPIGTLYPLICMSYFGGTFKDSSIVEIVFSAGTLLGAIVLGKWGKRMNKIYAIIFSIAGMGVGLIITGILQPDQFRVFIILAGFMGITIPFYYGVLTAIYQLKINEEYLGRVLSLSTSLSMIAMPLGLILSGSFADVIGVEKWFFLSGLLTVTIAGVCFLLPSLRNCCIEKEQ
ncbi:MAG: MFS transporter [Lachnospiraceae bacterium]|nr:MFS transporter [Lachnospiraceae bacterium]